MLLKAGASAGTGITDILKEQHPAHWHSKAQQRREHLPGSLAGKKPLPLTTWLPLAEHLGGFRMPARRRLSAEL